MPRWLLVVVLGSWVMASIVLALALSTLRAGIDNRSRPIVNRCPPETASVLGLNAFARCMNLSIGV